MIVLDDHDKLATLSETDITFTKVIGSNFGPLYNRCLRTTLSNKIHIFELGAAPEFELHLRYGYYEIGIPKRSNFKLCNIKKNIHVEIKINGKTDYSHSSGRERIFKEQRYILEYVGDFDRFKLLKEPYEPILKQVPNERNVVDLNKPLW
jgi:hypothetical protein